MKKIEFETGDEVKLEGYQCDYAGIKLGVNNQKCLSINYWTVFELSTGLMINTAKNQATRKQAIAKAVEFIKQKGIVIVRQQIQDMRLNKHLSKEINQNI